MTDQMPGHSTFGEREQEIRHANKAYYWSRDIAYLLSLLDQGREQKTELLEALKGTSVALNALRLSCSSVECRSHRKEIVEWVEYFIAKHKEQA